MKVVGLFAQFKSPVVHDDGPKLGMQRVLCNQSDIVSISIGAEGYAGSYCCQVP